MTLKLHTQASFSREIERVVCDKNIGYFEAVCTCCAEFNIEPEAVPKLINQQIKCLIEQEAIELNLLNRGEKKLKTLE